MTTRTALATAALVLLALATSAFAEDAKTLNKQGFDAAQAKDWKLAREKFEQSYALSPELLTLFNLAAAQEQTGRLIAARANYARYLSSSRPGPDHDRFRKAAIAKLPALEKSIPTLRVKAIGFASTVVIELDQRSLLANELTDPFQIDPGAHILLASRDGEVLVRKEFTVAVGAREEVALTAPPPKLEKPPPTPVIVRPIEKPPSEKPPGGVLRSGWFWGAASAVLIGGAAAYYFLYYDNVDPTRGTLGRGVLEL